MPIASRVIELLPDKGCTRDDGVRGSFRAGPAALVQAEGWVPGTKLVQAVLEHLPRVACGEVPAVAHLHRRQFISNVLAISVGTALTGRVHVVLERLPCMACSQLPSVAHLHDQLRVSAG